MSQRSRRPDTDIVARRARMRFDYDAGPFHAVLGLSLTTVNDGCVEVALDATKHARNRLGTIAGGVLATMIGSAIMQAVQTRLAPEDLVALVETKVNYVAPAREKRLVARAEIVHLGRATAVGEAKVRNADGGVVAAGLGTVAVRRGTGT